MMLSERDKETLMQIATVLRERASEKYVLHNEKYQHLLRIAEAAEDDCMKMELSDESTELINRMLQRQLDASEYQLTLTYLSGLLNGIGFIRNMGLLDMIFAEDGSIDPDQKGCYLVARIPGREGCIAVRSHYGKPLTSFVENWKGKGIELLVIDRPENYVEYEPYRFVSMMNIFLDEIKPFMTNKDGDGSVNENMRTDGERETDFPETMQ